MQFSKHAELDSKCGAELFVSGDFCPAMGPLDELQKEANVEGVFGEFCRIIKGADLSITNLECPLTHASKGIEKIGPNLKAPPDVAVLLKSVGFNMVTLANNHIYDFGQQGLFDTIDTLQRYKLSYVGGGLTLQEAQKTAFVELNGIKLAIVNFAELEFSTASTEHGGASPMDLIDNSRQIADARKKTDHVFVIVHGGNEHYQYPSPGIIKRYRFYAESGASAVIAHHTHCIGGYELHNDVPIFYSLGNFFFPPGDKPVHQCWYEGYAVLMHLTKSNVEFEILPYEQSKNGSLSIEVKRREKILAKIEDISSVISNDQLLAEKWYQFVEAKKVGYLARMSGFGIYKVAILRRLGVLDYFYRKRQLNNIRQMIRCEAHKEVALGALSRHLK